MADQDKKESEQKNIPIPERGVSADEQSIEFKKEGAVRSERREISPDEKVISDELKKEIELMQVDESTKEDAKKKAKEIEFLGEKDKLEHLLAVAREKGVVYAIEVARRMNEPYLLDMLHDILAKEGFYQKFTKPSDDDDDDDKKT